MWLFCFRRDMTFIMFVLVVMNSMAARAALCNATTITTTDGPVRAEDLSVGMLVRDGNGWARITSLSPGKAPEGSALVANKETGDELLLTLSHGVADTDVSGLELRMSSKYAIQILRMCDYVSVCTSTGGINGFPTCREEEAAPLDASGSGAPVAVFAALLLALCCWRHLSNRAL